MTHTKNAEMKSLTQAMTSTMQRMGANSVKQSNAEVEAVMTELVRQLRAIKPAWRQALATSDDVRSWKRQMLQALVEAGITTLAQVERGMVAARADANPWWPSVGQVVEWCRQGARHYSQHDIDEAFALMIAQKPARNAMEQHLFCEVGYRCRTQLAEDKARSVFTEAYHRWAAKSERGDIGTELALPAKAGQTALHNGEAVARAGEIPTGKGKVHFDAMRKRLSRSTCHHKTGGGHAH